MSGQSFSFPPPPPPPPAKRPDQDTSFTTRGRGGGRGYGPPRGRGGSFGQGLQRGFHGTGGRGGSRGRGPSFQRPDSRQPNDQSDRIPRYTQPRGGFPPQQGKRDHSTAFNQDALRKSRPLAAPAVPSFSASLSDILGPKHSTPLPEVKEKAAPAKKRNMLGLTPASKDSDSEDDAEEEARLAAMNGGLSLEFSYGGQMAALRTPAEVAAWIAERKRRYPTQAKRDAAKKEAEEKRKKIDEDKARAAALRATQKFRQQNRTVPGADKGQKAQQSTDDHASALRLAKLNAERLRRKAAKAQRDLEAAEAALANGAVLDVKEHHSSDDDSLGTVSDSSEMTDDSSESDDDRPPDAQSIKGQPPPTYTAPPPQPSRPKKPCVNFERTGKCRYGNRCHYSHTPATKASVPGKPPDKSKRRGLYQVMVEQEQEQQRIKALNTIISLGRQGLLQDDRTV